MRRSSVSLRRWKRHWRSKLESKKRVSPALAITAGWGPFWNECQSISLTFKMDGTRISWYYIIVQKTTQKASNNVTELDFVYTKPFQRAWKRLGYSIQDQDDLEAAIIDFSNIGQATRTAAFFRVISSRIPTVRTSSGIRLQRVIRGKVAALELSIVLSLRGRLLFSTFTRKTNARRYQTKRKKRSRD